MKIAHILNMANNGYHMVKALRNNGVDADLIIRSTDFGMALPQWEEEEITEDPYKIPFKKLIEKYDLPSYVKVWNEPRLTRKYRPLTAIPRLLRIANKGLKTYQFTVPDLYKMAKNYDVLHLHPPSPIFLHHLKKPKVVHESGWIRKIARGNSTTEKMGRRSYKKADAVVWTNPDTYPLLKPLGIKQLEFVPFIIDPDKYKPLNVEKNHELLFFHPARQVWDVKGNDRLLKAFAQFIQAGYKATLRLIDWGFEEDVAQAKKLISKENLEDYVEWLPPYSKPGLIQAYNEADAVFDQFLLGSGGTTCFESMSCEAPLVIHLNKWNEWCFGEMPPSIEASTPDEIYNAMIDLTDSKLRRKLGRAERDFTIKHNHPDTVASQLHKIYRGVYE